MTTTVKLLCCMNKHSSLFILSTMSDTFNFNQFVQSTYVYMFAGVIHEYTFACMFVLVCVCVINKIIPTVFLFPTRCGRQ